MDNSEFDDRDESHLDCESGRDNLPPSWPQSVAIAAEQPDETALPAGANWNGPTEPPTFELAATDDLLWLNPVSLDQLTSLIMDPDRWIQELNDLATDDPYISLKPDFALRLQLRAKSPGMSQDGKDCLVQSIIGTNLITVRPLTAIGENAGASWDDYWQEWRDEGLLDVTYNLDFQQGYAHVELTKEGDAPDVRADKIAAFLMLAADNTQFFQNDLYLNLILKKVPRTITETRHGANPVSVTPRVIFKPVDADSLLNVSFTLVANQSELRSLPSLLMHSETAAQVPVACDNMAGTLSEHLIVINDVVVKNYA